MAGTNWDEITFDEEGNIGHPPGIFINKEWLEINILGRDKIVIFHDGRLNIGGYQIHADGITTNEFYVVIEDKTGKKWAGVGVYGYGRPRFDAWLGIRENHALRLKRFMKQHGMDTDFNQLLLEHKAEEDR